MQRLHEADLAGDLIERGGYELLRPPEEFDPKQDVRLRIARSIRGKFRLQVQRPE